VVPIVGTVLCFASVLAGSLIMGITPPAALLDLGGLPESRCGATTMRLFIIGVQARCAAHLRGSRFSPTRVDWHRPKGNTDEEHRQGRACQWCHRRRRDRLRQYGSGRWQRIYGGERDMNPYPYPYPYPPPQPAKVSIPVWVIVLVRVIAVGMLSVMGLLVMAHPLVHRLSIVHSQSYNQGYDMMRNADSSRWDELRSYGYDARSACSMIEAFIPNKPADAGDWIRGCADALHDKGMR
jgi:hypothetical protein